jgi:signal transduction histidine kinase
MTGPATVRDPITTNTAHGDRAFNARAQPEVEAAIYFCCLEALQNVTKHAGPRATATISLERSGDVLQFEITDDGPGFDLTTADGSGLQGMTDRMAAIGGHVEITTAVGAGTRVTGAALLTMDAQVGALA